MKILIYVTGLLVSALAIASEINYRRNFEISDQTADSNYTIDVDMNEVCNSRGHSKNLDVVFQNQKVLF